MDGHIQIFLNRLSYTAIIIASLTLLLLFFQTPETCVPLDSHHKPHLSFPKSTCDYSPRELVPIDKKNKRLWSAKFWQKKVNSYIQFFKQIQDLGLLHNNSKAICVSAGAGHEVMALSDIGLIDVTGVELIDSPPLLLHDRRHPFF